jgi:hypothetical protein
MYRVLICGDREWKCQDLILMALRILGKDNIECVIEGEARGADKMGKAAAKELGLTEEQILEFPADWVKHGKAAGPIRNRKQFKEGKPNLVLAFHNDIKHSKGTKDMITVAKAGGVRTVLISETDVNEV